MSACQITLDRTRCAGIGLCEAISPDVFEIGDDGQLQLLVDVVEPARRQELEEAALNCPTQSITISTLG
jgi:ferredoxin